MTDAPKFHRRTFLKGSAQAAALAGMSGLFPETIRRALAIEPDVRSGTLQDVDHVVILMQENRSFDHYFGHLNGVRGFNDPRVLKRADGKSVMHQTYKTTEYLPYHFDTKNVHAQWLGSQNHEWSAFHGTWNEGRNDQWTAIQDYTAMGHFKRDDIPYYYALADAFTLGEAYHQSIMGPTNPNRLYHMTGRTAPTGDGKNVQYTNSMGDGTIGVSGSVDWTTYPERLSEANINWRIYQEGGYQSSSLWWLYLDLKWKWLIQEDNNYDCNALAWFKRFKESKPDSDLWQRAMVAREVTKLREDVQNNTLPQVSWIVPPYCYSEHPWWGPSFGEYYVSKILEALTSNPKVWARTVFIINYDEGDGYFDHVSAAVPPWKPGTGLSAVDTQGEIESATQLPIGLGPRVPVLAISPWSRGGKVSAEVFDHTSVLRFLEKRFGATADNISPWRRAVCGDLTSLFDFTGKTDSSVPANLTNLTETKARQDDAYYKQYYRSYPYYTNPTTLPGQETGQRDALAVPYQLHAEVSVAASDGSLLLNLRNEGMVLPENPYARSAAVFQVHSNERGAPAFYTVTSYDIHAATNLRSRGQTLIENLKDRIDANGRYGFEVRAPNGFYREFTGNNQLAKTLARPEVSVSYQGAQIVLTIKNTGVLACTVTVKSNPAYKGDTVHTLELKPGESLSDSWLLRSSSGWYDLTLTATNTESNFSRRLAGHVETGLPSRTDPLLDIMPS